LVIGEDVFFMDLTKSTISISVIKHISIKLMEFYE